MQEWIPILNEAALAGIVVFIGWGIIRICRFTAPLLTMYVKARITLAEDMQTFIQERIKVGESLVVSVGDIKTGVVRTEKCLDAIMVELNLPSHREGELPSQPVEEA